MTTDHAWYLSRNQYQPLIILSSSDKRRGAINYMYLTNFMILFITTYSDWMTNSGVLSQYLRMLHKSKNIFVRKKLNHNKFYTVKSRITGYHCKPL